MPLAPATVTYLATNPPVKKHFIDKGAVPDKGKMSARLQQIYDGSCENWAYTASKGGLLPSDVCGDIYMSANGPPGVVRNAKFTKLFTTFYGHIRETFGYLDNEKVGPTATAGKKARNAAKEQLAKCMRMVVEAVAAHNGFVLSPKQAKTKFAVVTEYEAAPDKPLYPNHTHSWLEYDGKYAFQTIPHTHLSIVQHHAGHQPHCGFVRVYVTDFLADQISAIDAIAADPIEAKTHILNCNLNKAISAMQLKADEPSPNE